MTLLRQVACAVGVVALAGMLLVILLVFLWPCVWRITAEEQSPGAQYLARVDESNCGALDNFQSFVEIHENRPRLGLAILGHSHANVLTLIGAGSQIRLHWESQTSLVVECDECKPEEVSVWMNSWKQVSIKYMLHAAGNSPTPK
jgi:hypothetical protein